MWLLELLMRKLNRRRHQHRHRGHHARHVWLKVSGVAVRLNPIEGTFIMSNLALNQIVTLSLIITNDAGVVSPADSAPVWTNSNAAAATSAVSSDGLTDVLTPVAAGVTTVVVTVMINGVAYTATVDETVIAAGLAGVKIVETFSPKP